MELIILVLVVELILGLVGEAVVEGVAFLLWPLGRALQSSYGWLVLLLVWVVSVAWFWVGWFAVGRSDTFVHAVAGLGFFVAPALAMLSTLHWRDHVRRLRAGHEQPRE